jgi:putative phosphoesterase
VRVGVISDTHIPRAARALPHGVFTAFSGVELILHAGDIVEESVLKTLETIAPVMAVCGNRDSEALKRALPEERILTLNGFRIGLLHGHGDKGTTLQRLPGFFAGEKLDCIVFGHSHIPYNEMLNGTLYFNPGSPTVKKRQAFPSVGILTLGDRVEGEVIYLHDR